MNGIKLMPGKCKGFRDNYLTLVSTILALLVSLSSYAQIDSNRAHAPITSYIDYKKSIRVSGALKPPTDTFRLALADTGAIATINRVQYVYSKVGNLLKWWPISGSGGVTPEGFFYFENGPGTSQLDTLVRQPNDTTLVVKSIGTDLPADYKQIGPDSIKYLIRKWVKDSAVTAITTTGTTGAATFVAGVLNIPNYGAGFQGWNGYHNASSYLTSSLNPNVNSTAWIFQASSPYTHNLPARSTNVNRVIFLKNAGTATWTISRAGSDQLYTDAAVTTITIEPGQDRLAVSDGSYWNIYDFGARGAPDASPTVRGLVNYGPYTQYFDGPKVSIGRFQVGNTGGESGDFQPANGGELVIQSSGAEPGQLKILNEYGDEFYKITHDADNVYTTSRNYSHSAGGTTILGLPGAGYSGGAYLGKGSFDPANGSDVTLLGNGSVSIPHGPGRGSDFFGNNSGGTNDHGNFGLHGSTEDNAIYMGVREGGGGFMRMITDGVLKASTTNATPTTKTITIDDESAGIIEISIVANEINYGGALTGKKILRFVKNGGTLTLGTPTTQLSDEASGALSTASWSFAATGNQIVATLNGVSATTIRWSLYYKIQPGN